MALIGVNNEEKIWNYLKAKGLNDYGIAGCMGNLYAESALRPNNLQNTYEKKLGYTDDGYVSAVDSGKYANFVRDSAGFGLAQWTYWSRKQALLNFAKSKGKSIGDLEMQLDFLWEELSEGYKTVLNTLKTATSVLEASNDMLFKFERPANQGESVQKKRAEYGQKYYDKYAVSGSQNATGATQSSQAGKLPTNAQNASTSNFEPSVGDVVYFNGTTHYVSSNSSKAVSCKPGEAKVTAVSRNAKHPYHLQKTSGSTSTVYGWVDATDIGIANNSTSSNTSASSDFKKRMTAPSVSDKYWIHTSNGGLNECIEINNSGSCLPNCVGYAWGRFYEITGKRPSLSRANAENWWGYTVDGYKRSQTPIEGAVICWRKGQAGNENDGAGHVAIVEEVKSNGDVVTSNSAYGGTRFYMKTVTKASNYSIGSAYTFQGFILPPNMGVFAPTENGGSTMGYTNSSLVSYTKISPNKSSPRNHAIDTITIHCVVGQCSVETLGNIFAPTSRKASSNYGVGTDGRIGMYVEEKDRSWCTSSSSNDNRAITIEVASDTTEPYAVNAKAYAAMLDLVTDICKRNGIKKLVWSNNKNERVNHLNGCNMTVHRDYANKSCPGTYLYERHAAIAAEVNKRLGVVDVNPPVENTTTPSTPSSSSIKAGDTVKIASGATYYNGKSIPSWVQKKNWIVNSIGGDRAVIDKSEDGKNAIMSPINVKFLSVVSSSASTNGGGTNVSNVPYLVKVTTSALNIRKQPTTNSAITGTIKDKGVYTIVQESSGTGASKWGKLKSGAGWISLDYTEKV